MDDSEFYILGKVLGQDIDCRGSKACDAVLFFLL